MCELVYLDQFREAVADAKAAEEAVALSEETAELIADAEADMAHALDTMDERTAKVAIDIVFTKVSMVPELDARIRLMRHVVECVHKTKTNFQLEVDTF